MQKKMSEYSSSCLLKPGLYTDLFVHYMGKVQSDTTCNCKLCLTVLYPYYDPTQHNGDVSFESYKCQSSLLPQTRKLEKDYKLCLTVLYPYYDPIQHNGMSHLKGLVRIS